MWQDPVENVVGMYEAFWGHQMVPEDLYQEWNKECGSKLDAATFETQVRPSSDLGRWTRGARALPYQSLREEAIACILTTIANSHIFRMGPLSVPQTCRTLQNAMWYLIGDVNPYGLDYPVCHEGSGSTKRSHKNKPQQPVRPPEFRLIGLGLYASFRPYLGPDGHSS